MGINFVDQGSGFQIIWKNRIIINHQRSKPAFSIGRGEDISESHSGFFKIKEKNVHLHPLLDWNLDFYDENELKITFNNDLTVLFSIENNRITISSTALNKSYNRFRLKLEADLNEQIYGGGEQYGHLNLRGKKVPIWISEPGVGRRFDLLTLGFALRTKYFPRWFNTYISMPSWVGTSGMYCYSTSSAYSVLNFKKRDSYEIYVWEIPAKIIIGVGTSLPEAVAGLSDLLGRQPKLPDWIYDGMMLGLQGGREVVSEKAKKVTAAGVKLNALWCQDWEGFRKTSFGKQLRWAWKYDDKLYPGLPEFITELREKGIRYLAYNNTFLTPGSEMFDEARDRGYLVKKQNNDIYFVDVPFDPAGMVDFTNPEACTWLKTIIKKNMIEIGISGWMADMGEMIPHDCVLDSGEAGTTYHNRYPVDWARLNYEAVLEAEKEDEIMCFYRAGYCGSAKYSNMFWNGDQMVDWTREDGLPSAILGSLTLGLSGAGYIHSDIGGYTTLGYKKRSAELLMRWIEFSTFTQAMRSHEGNRPHRNVQISDNDTVIKHLAKMVEVYTGLKPYHQEISGEYQDKGYPSMRILPFHYPAETKHLSRWKYQYLYGRDLLVAPVLKPGKRSWKVRLPEDRWIHLWTGKEYAGNLTVKVEAPLGQPPVFYRADSKWKTLFEALI